MFSDWLLYIKYCKTFKLWFITIFLISPFRLWSFRGCLSIAWFRFGKHLMVSGILFDGRHSLLWTTVEIPSTVHFIAWCHWINVTNFVSMLENYRLFCDRDQIFFFVCEKLMSWQIIIILVCSKLSETLSGLCILQKLQPNCISWRN